MSKGRIHGSVVDVALDELTAGEVVIRAAYSSVNYKDALAATGQGKIPRRFPLIGGIDRRIGHRRFRLRPSLPRG